MRKVVGGFTALALSTVGSQLLGFLALAVVARRLGPENLGTYSFAANLTRYFALAASMGVAVAGTRDVVRRPEARQTILRETLALQAGLAALSYGALTVLAPILTPSSEAAAILPITGLLMIVNAVSFQWLLQADRRFSSIAIATLIGQVVYAIVAVSFTRTGPEGAQDYAWFNILGAAVTMVIIDATALRSVPLRIRFPELRSLARRFWGAAPIAAGLALIQVYATLDTVMLGYLSTAKAVGDYAIAYKLPLALITLAGVWARALYPHATEMVRDGRREQLAHDVGRAAGLALCLGVPALSTAAVVGTPLMVALFGQDYEDAGLPFILLTLVGLIVAVSVNFGNTMIAIGRQRVFLIGTALGAGIDIALNVALIPPLDTVGAALSTAAAELIVLIYMITRFERVVASVLWPRSDLGRSLIAAAAAGAATGAALGSWGLGAALSVAVVANGALWYALDIQHARSLVIRGVGIARGLGWPGHADRG